MSYRYSHHALRDGVTAHLFPTEKRKTLSLAIYWLGDLGEDVTARALLPSVLARGTRSYPTLQSLTRRLEELYGASFNADVTKVGERHLMSFRFSFVSDGYLPAGESIFSDVIDLAREALFDPHFEDGRFPDPVVAQEKVGLERHIASLINDKSDYAMRRCVELACADEEYRRYEWGNEADLLAIRSETLVDLWREEQQHAPMEIYLSGSFDESAALAALAPLIEGRGAPRALREASPMRTPAEVRTVNETLDVNQSNVVMLHRTGIRYGSDQIAALSVTNGILGAFPHSKLFQVVREKHSLAYSVWSYPDRSQGLLYISAGVPPEKREDAIRLSRAQLDDL
ncbi:MAG: insulinase family protein, partial [Planctomycetota bacterium]